MKLTIEKLNDLNACPEGIEWFVASKCKTVAGACKKVMKEDNHYWANWLVARLLGSDDRIRYACFASRQVLKNYEDKYPTDMRPRKAIGAAEKCITDKSDAPRRAAWSAARAARSAACSAARSAEWSAERSADSAAWSADSAAWSAARSAEWSAACSADSAAWAERDDFAERAVSAKWSASSVMSKKIINYGLKLLEKKEIKKPVQVRRKVFVKWEDQIDQAEYRLDDR